MFLSLNILTLSAQIDFFDMKHIDGRGFATVFKDSLQGHFQGKLSGVTSITTTTHRRVLKWSA
jgi:hypothetical protein